MGKRAGALIILLFIICIVPLVQSVSIPFTVYGSVHQTNILVIITNARTHETMTATSDSNCFYQANLGNMESQWMRGDKIYVNVSSISTNFTIPGNGYIYRRDINLPNCVQYISNEISTTVIVVEGEQP